jgi:hypothetical protein
MRAFLSSPAEGSEGRVRTLMVLPALRRLFIALAIAGAIVLGLILLAAA